MEPCPVEAVMHACAMRVPCAMRRTARWRPPLMWSAVGPSLSCSSAHHRGRPDRPTARPPRSCHQLRTCMHADTHKRPREGHAPHRALPAPHMHAPVDRWGRRTRGRRTRCWRGRSLGLGWPRRGARSTRALPRARHIAQLRQQVVDVHRDAVCGGRTRLACVSFFTLFIRFPESHYQICSSLQGAQRHGYSRWGCSAAAAWLPHVNDVASAISFDPHRSPALPQGTQQGRAPAAGHRERS
jgi:hypothetical protein